MKNIYKVLAIAFSVAPVAVIAQGLITQAQSIVQGLQGVVNLAFPLLIGVAAIVFVWGVIKFIFTGAADDKARAEGRKMIIWSLIGLAVIVGISGLLTLILSTVGTTQGGGIVKPTI